MVRLFKVSIPSSAVALILSEAFLLFFCYLLAARLVLDVPLVVFLFEQGGYWHILFAMAVIILGLYFTNMYEDYRVHSRIQLIQQFCLVLGVAFLLQSLLSYAQWGILLPKWVMVYGSLIVMVVLPLWRIIFTAQSLGEQKLLFLGSSPAMRDIVDVLAKRPELGLASIGYLDCGEDAAVELPGTPRLGSIADLDEVITERQPARVVVGMSRGLPVERLLELRLGGLQIEEASDTYEMIFRRVSTRDLPPSLLIFSNEMSPKATAVTLQSAYSLLFGLIALVVLLPVMAVIALIVKFTSRGPVLRLQECAGFNGTRFRRYCFRVSPSSVWAKLRLSGLPQLFNVVKGEMSLVGPRPERPEFASVLEEKIPYYRQRLCVKPGITGWAQINEKKTGEVEDTIAKLEYDRYYIKNLSLSLDAYIVFHTLLGR